MKTVVILAFFLTFSSCSARSPFIVGGREAVVGAYPWQGSMEYYEGSHYCGCSLISTKWVLTAAHCVNIYTPPSSVMLGMHDRYLEKGEPTNYKVRRAVIHPSYMRGYGFHPNDVALLELTDEVELTDYVQTIALPEPDQKHHGQRGVITGWGLAHPWGYAIPAEEEASAIRDGDDIFLQEAWMEIYTDQHCQGVWGSYYQESHNVCLGSYGKSACNGDSGGPLSVQDDAGNWVLVGVASYVAAGCNPYYNYPSVYTRVSAFIPWIKQVTDLQ